jgi:hypothetical protein
MSPPRQIFFRFLCGPCIKKSRLLVFTKLLVILWNYFAISLCVLYSNFSFSLRYVSCQGGLYDHFALCVCPPTFFFRLLCVPCCIRRKYKIFLPRTSCLINLLLQELELFKPWSCDESVAPLRWRTTFPSEHGDSVGLVWMRRSSNSTQVDSSKPMTACSEASCRAGGKLPVPCAPGAGSASASVTVNAWALFQLLSVFIEPITVTALSSPARTLGSWVRISHEAWMSVCAFILFVLSCVQVASLRRANPPSKEFNRLYKRIKNLKKRPRSNRGAVKT